MLVGLPNSCLGVLPFTSYDKVWLSLACCLSVIWDKNEIFFLAGGAQWSNREANFFSQVDKNFLMLQLLWAIIYVFMFPSLATWQNIDWNHQDYSMEHYF